MIEVISEITGIVIAAGILAGVRKLGELTNAVRDLDLRVSTLERWLQRPGFQQPAAGGDYDPFAAEVRGGDCPRGS